MEEFDDDDFSDLYADVEVQASSAISALHRSTELPPRSDRISANAPRGENKAAEERDAARQEAKEEKAGGCGDLRNLPVENGDRCESGSTSWSESESERDSEDRLASDGYDEVERKVGENYERKRYEEISGKEKTVNGGDYSSQSQRKYNSSNSKTKRVHETTQQVRRTCRKGDSDDRNPFFSSEDNQPNYGRKHGGPEIASERHTEASYPVPLDLDKRGSVQISDSVEDSPCEVSECDSDGISETSDDTDRRKASCISNKVSSAREPDAFKSSWSQRGQGYPSSPSRAAYGSRYFEKSPKRLRYSSSSLHCESQDPITHKYHPPKHSESRGVRRGTRDGGYYERRQDSTRKHSNQPKKSNYMPYFKNRADEDASYATDAKHLYNRHVNQHRAMVDLKINETDVPFCSYSERMLTYSGGRLPDHHMGQAFLKNQYWDNPNSRYKAGPLDGHNISERKNFLDKRSSQMDYESSEYYRYHNQRRHQFQGDIEGLRNLSLKYSSTVDHRGTQLLYKGEGERLRRRTRQDCLPPVHDYDDRYVEGRRIRPSSGGDRDHLDCRYDRDVAHDRREVESSSKGNRRRHSPLNSSENFCYIENEVNDRRNIKHQPFPFYPSEEPYASGRGEFLGASGPKTGVAQRNIRCSRREMRIECDQYDTDVATFVPRENLRYCSPEDFHVKRRDYQPSSNTNYTRESIRYEDHFVGRRRNQHSEVFLPKEDVDKSRQQDRIVFGSEERSHKSKRILKNDEADGKPASCRIMELSEREMRRRNSNILGEEENSNHFDGCHKSTKLNSHAQRHPSHQDSVDRLVVKGRKCTLQSSIRRTTEAGEDTYYGKCDLVGSTDNKEPNNSEDTDEFKPEKTVPTDEGEINASLSGRNQQSKFSKNHQNESLNTEEGQIITEEIQNEDESQINVSGHPETTSNDNRVVEKLDDEKIKEIIMKMERRRERFKEPVTTSRDGEKVCRDGEKTFSPLPDSNVETAEARLERPARKRRWLGT
ncbi:uncharacterized protein LOC131024234 isoform X2 [Salvia miltiorrhiza]|uniref:uncharacterized protein LOC131024234 isoform X2 n=1 Tax=Salvia miltiorrhiza TaxID=226208 RepID=UPI0025AD93AC|nr:uncharacterized protein LOC131024234 isoform X2 [Salvia miltiorrhiza]